MPAQLVKVTFHGGSLALKDKTWRGFSFKREANGVNWLPEADAKLAAQERDFTVDWDAVLGDNKNEIADLRSAVENLQARVQELEKKQAPDGEAEQAPDGEAEQAPDGEAEQAPAPRRGRPPKVE